MAGIYIHIPFCKQACHYCNFHFSTSLKHKAPLIDAIVREIALSKSYLKNQVVETVYFGGGTPSLLSAEEFNRLFDSLHKYHTISEDAEVTLEANPDDLTQKYLEELRSTPVNRLSIGIQSFFEEDLHYMNRAHDAQQANQCIEDAQANDFNNLSIDLIYGSPTTSHAHWKRNIEIALHYRIPHISCYALTVEPKTALDHFIRTRKTEAPDDDVASKQFHYLINTLTGNGYEHYEISNFALPGHYSRHNTAYWQGTTYLGLGPSAHSFDANSRRWNVANNAHYIKLIESGEIPCETEVLSAKDRYNEYIMTSLRTQWGIPENRINDFGTTIANHFRNAAAAKLKEGLIVVENEHFKLSKKAKFLADGIISDLFFV
ncbi:MAG: radical SAM family heme chaperone HemW [Bacteroidota bacterium]